VNAETAHVDVESRHDGQRLAARRRREDDVFDVPRMSACRPARASRRTLTDVLARPRTRVAGASRGM
jgi:hypothetical protein